MPRPALPPELAETMQWEGENPYRTTRPAPSNSRPSTGSCPMNRRWRIGMLLSTLLWGGSFVGMVGVAWHMAFSSEHAPTHIAGKKNNTYFILPKAGEPPQAGAKPHARDMVAAINPAYLEFSKTRRTSFRPMNILLSIWGAGGLGFLAMLPMVVMSWTNVDRNGPGLPLVGTLILAICLWIAIGVPLRQLRRPHSPSCSASACAVSTNGRASRRVGRHWTTTRWCPSLPA